MMFGTMYMYMNLNTTAVTVMINILYFLVTCLSYFSSTLVDSTIYSFLFVLFVAIL